MRWKVAAVVIAMIALHQDFWLWDDATLVFGILPAGLAYHFGYSIAASAMLALLVRRAWPAPLEADATDPDPAESKADPASAEVSS